MFHSGAKAYCGMLPYTTTPMTRREVGAVGEGDVGWFGWKQFNWEMEKKMESMFPIGCFEGPPLH